MQLFVVLGEFHWTGCSDSSSDRGEQIRAAPMLEPQYQRCELWVGIEAHVLRAGFCDLNE